MLNIIRIPSGYTLEYPMAIYFKKNIEIFQPYLKAINDIFGDRHINLLVTGSSGLLLAGLIVMQRENTEIVYFRKNGESSHGSSIEYDKHKVDKEREHGINLMVDDLISTGDTMRFLKEKADKSKDFPKIHGICVTNIVNKSNIESIVPEIDYLFCKGYTEFIETEIKVFTK